MRTSTTEPFPLLLACIGVQLETRCTDLTQHAEDGRSPVADYREKGIFIFIFILRMEVGERRKEKKY
jgi:hypothetical protein